MHGMRTLRRDRVRAIDHRVIFACDRCPWAVTVPAHAPDVDAQLIAAAAAYETHRCLTESSNR